MIGNKEYISADRGADYIDAGSARKGCDFEKCSRPWIGQAQDTPDIVEWYTGEQGYEQQRDTQRKSQIAHQRTPSRGRPGVASVSQHCASETDFGASAFSGERYAIKLHAMVNQPVAQLFGNLLLQCFKFRIDKFDNLAGFYVNQVIVV